MVTDDDKKVHGYEVKSTLTISKALKEIFEKLFPKKKYYEYYGEFRVFTKENNQDVEISMEDRATKIVLNYQNLYVNFKQQKMSLVSNNVF